VNIPPHGVGTFLAISEDLKLATDTRRRAKQLSSLEILQRSRDGQDVGPIVRVELTGD
jgi:hypothetical protein